MAYYRYELGSDERLVTAIQRTVEHVRDERLPHVDLNAAAIDTHNLERLFDDPDGIQPDTFVSFRYFDTEVTISVESRETLRIDAKQVDP